MLGFDQSAYDRSLTQLPKDAVPAGDRRTSAAAHALAALRELRILVLPTKSTLTKTCCTPPGSEVVAADSCGGTCAASAYPSWVAERAEPKSATCSSQEAKRVKTGRAPLHQRSAGAAAACKD